MEGPKLLLRWMPIPATWAAGQWDLLYSFLVYVSIALFLLTIGGMVYFLFRFRYTRVKKAGHLAESSVTEAILIGAPTVLVMGIFFWGVHVYQALTKAPLDAMEVRVLGKQWNWTFQYEDGRTLTNELVVPVNKPVRLVMTSDDVLHSFFVPNFRIKRDLVPGMYSYAWFEATLIGEHHLFCAEYCGTSHSGMIGKVIVLSEQDYKMWSYGKKLGPQNDVLKEFEVGSQTEKQEAPMKVVHSLAHHGRGVFMSNCVQCHNNQGSDTGGLIGPSLVGVWGKQQVYADNTQGTVDENFIKLKIENPRVKVRKGYPAIMPTFKGLISENEMHALMAYLKTL
jgi:cytochrome c oxidase subunit 2